MLKRDFALIPLISLLTVVMLVGAGEWLARVRFEEGGRENCAVPDPLHGERLAGPCSSRRKSAEGPWVENRYNSCGYRTAEPCGDRPAGSVRIALMGASTAQGFKVPYEQAFAPRASVALAAACKRPVEIQNLGVPGYKVIDHYFRVDEALALKPDVAVLVLSAYEMVQQTDPAVFRLRKTPELIPRRGQSGPVGQRPQQAALAGTADLVILVDRLVAKSRAVTAAQHYLYQDRARYVDLFLLHGDKADYLRPPFTAAWERRMAEFEILLGEMADRMRQRGVPLVLFFTPQRVQAALVDPAAWPAGVDPTAIDARMAQIARKAGVVMVDALADLKAVPQPEKLYYPVDGHMTGEGHAVLARSLVDHLLGQRVGVFASCH